MANCHIDLKNCDAKVIYSELRKAAASFDPLAARSHMPVHELAATRDVSGPRFEMEVKGWRNQK